MPANRDDDRPDARLVLLALCLLVFSVTCQTMIVAPILPRIAEQVRVPEARLGMLVAGYAAAVAAVALVAGPLSDRVGRRRMLLVGSGLMTVGLALHGLADGYRSLLAVRIFTGAAGGALTGASAAYVGDYFPPDRRGWANGWLASGMALGQIVGIPLGTLLAGQAGFQAPFLVFAVAMGAAFALVWRFLPQPEVERVEGRLRARWLVTHYTEMLGSAHARAAVVSYLAIFLGTSLYVLYLPTWLEGARGATPGDIALLFAAGGIATVLAGPRAGALSDRAGRKRLIVASSAGIAGVMIVTTTLVREVWIAYPVFFLLTGLFAVRASPLQALMTEIVPDTERGSLMSLSMALGQVGAGVGAAIAGAAYGAFGYGSNTALAAVSSLLVGGLVWRFLPESVVVGAASAAQR